jgi:hypothetical protein
MKAFRALLLVLALSVCSYAGEMPCGRDGNIPNGRAGEMPFGKAGDIPYGKAETTDLSTEIALYLLQSVLPLL